jgi:hypothetical protein
MVLQSQPAAEVDSCRYLLQGQAKNLADRLFGPGGPPVGTSFDQLERIALEVSSQLRKLLLDLLLGRQAEAMHRDLPDHLRRCPTCEGDTTAEEPAARWLHCHAATVEWLEPHRYCQRCRKAFFPQSKSLGIDVGHYSIALLDLIAYAGANKLSFREASLDLAKLGGHRVHEKQVERLSKRIGLERLAERQREVDHFTKLTLAQRKDTTPAGVEPPGKDQVAVVMADAGMLQLRDEAVTSPKDKPDAAEAEAEAAGAGAAEAGVPEETKTPSPAEALPEEEDDDDQDKPPSGRHWHEDKAGLVMTMTSNISAADPCPEIPKTFLDPERVAKIVRGLKKSAALQAEEQAAEDPVTEDTPALQAPADQTYDGPKLAKRQVVASRQSWPVFGVMLACAAWMAGFAKAARRAFVADGARAIWRVWQSRFSSYVPILDFIHAMSYVYAAAKAVGADSALGWKLYAEWIRWTWQGKVGLVIEQLRHWQSEHGKPEKGEGATTNRSVVAKSLRYLENNQEKMKYAEYRQQGLPLVSSLVESMVKQISRRVKGTEKFWTDEGAEAILQLRADYLSDGDVMERFWQRRQATATGQRSYRTHS